jgi:hypothetical protein
LASTRFSCWQLGHFMEASRNRCEASRNWCTVKYLSVARYQQQADRLRQFLQAIFRRRPDNLVRAGSKCGEARWSNSACGGRSTVRDMAPSAAPPAWRSVHRQPNCPCGAVAAPLERHPSINGYSSGRSARRLAGRGLGRFMDRQRGTLTPRARWVV